MIRDKQEFLKIALRSYDNPIMTSMSDFEADLKRFNHLNTMINRYAHDLEDTRLRQILNHVIIISNCFGIKNSVDMIRFKIGVSEFLETILYFLKMIAVTSKLDFSLLKKLESL